MANPIVKYFECDHLPPHLRAVSEKFYRLVHEFDSVPEGPEKTTGLRKLLEAKDCMVRASLETTD